MVKDRRYVFDVDDISSIIYACPHCGHEVVCKLDSQYEPGSNCHNCRSPILAANPETGRNPALTFLHNLRWVLGMPKGGVRVRVVVPYQDEGKGDA